MAIRPLANRLRWWLRNASEIGGPGRDH